MNDPLSTLEPRSIWGHFDSILAIPRPSKHEERIVRWVRSLAEERGWEVRSDDTGNLVLAVPATPGAENAPIVVLQAHLDMVCEKNKGVEHDFMNDPIRPRLEDGWVYATGTTLGADNGLGVAAALAAATDPDVKHPPLELLFTIDEETGLTGAQGLDGSILQGRMLINLDSEEDGKLFVGCAGGADCRLWLDVERERAESGSATWRLLVRGLRGGHSGLNIHENRGNALKLLTRTLRAADDAGVRFGIVELQGGSKHNAIPREAEADLRIDEAGLAKLREVLQRTEKDFRGELAGIDDGLQIRLEELPGTDAPVYSRAFTSRYLDLLSALPHGVLGMSADVPGLVETSISLAVVRPEDERIEITTSARSSVNSLLHSTASSIHSLGRLAGAQVETCNSYPGWKPNMSSRALEVVKGAWTELYGPPEITAVHAGLECGLLGEKVEDLDMISLGPQIEGAHSPEERVQVDSVGRFWKALSKTLERLAEG